jgi:hypothetical protein
MCLVSMSYLPRPSSRLLQLNEGASLALCRQQAEIKTTAVHAAIGAAGIIAFFSEDPTTAVGWVLAYLTLYRGASIHWNVYRIQQILHSELRVQEAAKTSASAGETSRNPCKTSMPSAIVLRLLCSLAC